LAEFERNYARHLRCLTPSSSPGSIGSWETWDRSPMARRRRWPRCACFAMLLSRNPSAERRGAGRRARPAAPRADGAFSGGRGAAVFSFRPALAKSSPHSATAPAPAQSDTPSPEVIAIPGMRASVVCSQAATAARPGGHRWQGKKGKKRGREEKREQRGLFLARSVAEKPRRSASQGSTRAAGGKWDSTWRLFGRGGCPHPPQRLP